MKAILSIITILLAALPAFSQTVTPCGFNDPNAKTPRKDQYAMSSKGAIDKSKKAMADQSDQFDKKKYQATVKGKGLNNKKKMVPRYM
jgi:hypothetical protein